MKTLAKGEYYKQGQFSAGAVLGGIGIYAFALGAEILNYFLVKQTFTDTPAYN